MAFGNRRFNSRSNSRQIEDQVTMRTQSRGCRAFRSTDALLLEAVPPGLGVVEWWNGVPAPFSAINYACNDAHYGSWDKQISPPFRPPENGATNGLFFFFFVPTLTMRKLAGFVIGLEGLLQTLRCRLTGWPRPSVPTVKCIQAKCQQNFGPAISRGFSVYRNWHVCSLWHVPSFSYTGPFSSGWATGLISWVL